MSDHFQIVPGSVPVAIGAPHHGTRPNVDADQGTGPIALALGARLGARVIVVSDLRRIADVNKNPVHLGRDVRHHAIRYQNELFDGLPSLVIEIHGHVSGRYAIEATPGFELDAAAEEDAGYLQHLRIMKDTLLSVLPAKIGFSPSVGVYPLDRDIQMTATGTFTFQKIRRARYMAGAAVYGLHIELGAELRTTRQARSLAFIEALSDALASAVQAAFFPLAKMNPTISYHSRLNEDDLAPLASRQFKAVDVPNHYAPDNVAVLHPDELDALGLLEGDVVIVSNGGEVIRTSLAASRVIPRGQVGLPARLRSQVSAGHGAAVRINKAPPQPSAAAGQNYTAALVSRIDSGRELTMCLAPAEISRLGLLKPEISVQSQPTIAPISHVKLQPDPALMLHLAIASRGLAERLSLTIGEVVIIK